MHVENCKSEGQLISDGNLPKMVSKKLHETWQPGYKKKESENGSSYQSCFVETTLYAAKLVQGKIGKYICYQEEIKSAKPSAFNYTLPTGTSISVVRKRGLKGKNLNFGRK